MLKGAGYTVSRKGTKAETFTLLPFKRKHRCNRCLRSEFRFESGEPVTLAVWVDDKTYGACPIAKRVRCSSVRGIWGEMEATALNTFADAMLAAREKKPDKQLGAEQT